MIRPVLTLTLALLPFPAYAQRNATVPDPDPEIERRSFIVAPGFEVTLWAADPLLAKPIQLNWDPQGRLWVATSEVYPQIEPGQKANDKIIILEDTKGTGKADKTTVFADGLLIPTAVVPGDGGAYVANSTEIVHLAASKPGEKADKSRVVLSGFGTEDTHHIIHTFRWGPDGCLYFNQSIYIHSHVETPSGVKRLNAGGIWRFNTKTNDLSVFARGWINPWGHAFDKFGQSFVTDGAGGEGINHAIPGAYFMESKGPHAGRILHGLNPGSPKYCGLEILSGRHLPDDWQGDLITNDFRGHRVCRFKLQDDGSTFASREMPELIKSNHPAFRPIDVKVGPDGAIYIADWYNPIIQHGEVDFRDPRRDHTHGRIWRVAAKGRPAVQKPELVTATVPQLLDRLKDPEDWTREQARRVLKERGATAVLPELEKWIRTVRSVGGNERDRHLSEAMWVYESFGSFHSLPPHPSAEANQPFGLLADLLSCGTAGVRARAARLLGSSGVDPNRKAQLLAESARDEVPAVRLDVVRALAAVPVTQAVEAALRILDRPTDRTLDYALWLTLRELESVWLPEFVRGNVTFGNDPKKIAFALQASGNPATIPALRKLLDAGTLTATQSVDLWELLARIGGPTDLGAVLARCLAPGVVSAERVRLAAAVEEAVRSRRVGPPGTVQPLKTLIGHSDRPAAQIATRLVGLWKVADLRLEVEMAAAQRPDPDPADVAAAVEAIALFGDKRASDLLLQLSNPTISPKVTTHRAFVAYARLAPAEAAKLTPEYLRILSDPAEVAEMFGAFLTRKGSPQLLATALAGQTLPPDVAKVGIRVAKASAQSSAELIAALTKAGNLTATKPYPTEGEVKQFAAAVATHGDPRRGEIVFRKKDNQCLNCHAIGGAGGKVGPDLTSIGASAQVDYLVESILNPNKAVKEGYHAVKVTTKAGAVVQGVPGKEANGELTLRDSEDKEIKVRLDQIEEKVPTRSLMADGLADPLTRQEILDLVRFLSELGKVGPYGPQTARVVRRWQAVDSGNQNTNKMRQARISAVADPAVEFLWLPAYAQTSGDLPLADLPKFTVWNNTAAQSVVRCQFDVTTPGKARLRFNDPAGLTLYLGPNPVEAKAETNLDFPAGIQTVTIIVDRSLRTKDLRIELDDVPGSNARVAIVNGK